MLASCSLILFSNFSYSVSSSALSLSSIYEALASSLSSCVIGPKASSNKFLKIDWSAISSLRLTSDLCLFDLVDTGISLILWK